MSTRLTATLAVLAACSGSSDVISPPASCDGLASAPLGSVDQALWPDGVQEALDLYERLPGTWSTDNSCGNSATVKFIPSDQESLQIVTSEWPRFPGLACGCTVDPKYPPDPMFDLVMVIPNYQVYVEDFGDPGVEQQNVTTNGAFYVPDEPLIMRTCGQRNIDPLIGSDYSSASYAVRVLPGGVNGVLQLAITLTDDRGAKKVCDLDNFDFIAGL